MASPTLLTHPLAAILQSISSALQRIANQLDCGGPLATSWTPNIVTVPAAGPGVLGVELLTANPNRLGAMIVNTDASTTIWLGPTTQVGYVGSSSGLQGTPIFPQQAIAWSFSDKDRGLARYAIAVGAAVQVAVTEIT